MTRPSDAKIKVLIADDHTIVRAGLAALLGTEHDLEVIGQAKNGVEAIHETIRLRPDVVIMDLMMPKKDGVEATAEISAKVPTAKVILLTTFGTSDGIAHALANGANGAILKDADNTQIAAAIRKVASGGEYVIGQGGGAMEQHANCVDVEWDEVQPGDLLFYPEDEHVGIAAGRDWLGRLLVVHCASGTGGMAISHRTGFETAARPVWYGDE